MTVPSFDLLLFVAWYTSITVTAVLAYSYGYEAGKMKGIRLCSMKEDNP
jgi:hypothetical protein